MDALFALLDTVNGIMLGVPTLVGLLCVGVLFTLSSGFGQYRSLTHGVRLLRGNVPGVSGHGPGALSHFQALSAALSGTVGLGNIAGVAIAVGYGGPGAVFWMWMVGLAGMAVKSAEVTLSLLYRDVSDPDHPHGGTMYVLRRGLPSVWPKLARFGGAVGALWAVFMLVFAVTGGNMFQAWAVADTTFAYFGLPQWITGLLLAGLTGAVILGGVKRIGAVAGMLVPFMCGIYIVCGVWVLFANAERLPEVFALIFRCAFSPAEGQGAFTGAVMGTAFMWGMKRALFSSESGLGTAPMAHSAVKTPEPVTEGVVAGLEPFIDTLVVCTVTALVILSSGVWNRGPAAAFGSTPSLVEVSPGARLWQPDAKALPPSAGAWKPGDQVFVVADAGGGQRTRIYGTVVAGEHGDVADWRPVAAGAGGSAPKLAENGVFVDYRGSTLAAKAFDSAHEGLGRWMVTLTIWLFALSTIITYGYYGEQGLIFLGGRTLVPAFRWVWCITAFVTCLGFIRTSEELDTISTVAMGFMYAINLPLMVVLGFKAMGAWHDYFRRLKSGELRAR
jgi:alanine or glycine:cation symporter, AGCS family